METDEPKTKRKQYDPKFYLNRFFAIAFIIIFSYYFFSPPVFNRSIANRQPTVIHISKGQSINDIATYLAESHAVRSAVVLKSFIKIFQFGRPLAIGDYRIEQGVPVWSIAWQLARGHHNVSPIKVTFPEGSTNDEMAQILAQKLAGFRKDLFSELTDSKQGYLFPDTYFFYSLSTADEIVSALATNFDNHITKLAEDIETSGHTEKEIIILASIVQKEAKNDQDSPIIAGILWKRIESGMPLQVDADKDTYSKLGLPSEPISNPGIVAIDAAIHPADSPYLYYLHDKNGQVHFAATYAEHLQNINRYLK